ncbi:PC4 domain-containing protein [Trichonephila clavipes]|nr:PC4 domain-containing protein [Trichonephila clavipes]
MGSNLYTGGTKFSKNGGASPPRTAFVHVPNFDQNRNFFQSRPLHRRSIHAEFKPLHRVCFDKDNGKASSFKPDAVPENHFHLGSHNYAVVSDFADVARIHLRRYKLDATASLLPTKDGITVTPSVWLALVREFLQSIKPLRMEKYLLSRTVSYFPELLSRMSLISYGNCCESTKERRGG